MSEIDPSVWYQCQRCAQCCRWPGEVILTDADITRIAEFLEISEFDFIQKHTAVRRNRAGLTLTEKPNGECEFLDGFSCTIQDAKPEQCSGFPNKWNFPGWRKSCEAIPIPVAEKLDVSSSDDHDAK
ncbi:MAG: YkgJ family cysteine cluster protein [Verrucomicrobiota bacterium]